MSNKIFRAILLATASVLLACVLVILGCLYRYFGEVQEGQLRDELRLAAAAVENQGADYLQKIQPGQYRLTWISAEGGVLYDTDADANQMENHAGREEFRAALETGEGSSSRYSDTMLTKTVYYAHRLSDGTVLRISVSQATAGQVALGMLQPILIVLCLSLVLSALLASRLAHSVVDPLNKLDLEHPLDNPDAYEELAPLLGRLNRQRSEIDRQMRALKQKSEEFNQIIANMQEGLALLDDKGRVLSMNPAARRLYAAPADYQGRPFIALERDHEINHAIEQAMDQGHGEARCQRQGREYQLDASRILCEGAPRGAVVLSFDITEQEYAARNRREFTANVSHELKTPLQGIIGSAELIESGMVKPQDMPRFVGHIRTEAARMVTLIGDIIRLSQLDEGVEMPREETDLLAVCQEAAEHLQDEAQKKRVALTVEGDPARINGVRRLLYEIVFNLCDNAIKYNVENGSVRVLVKNAGDGVSVAVSDTGVGIPPEDQSRVFERFYRVDKSHSKASGGTGLGLSIVKHAVQYHQGRIQLDSAPGQGTRIQVFFPRG